MADHRDRAWHAALIVSFTAAAVAWPSLPVPVFAAEEGRGSGCINKRIICVDVGSDPTPDKEAPSGGRRRNTSPFRWRRYVVQGACGKLTYNGRMIAPPAGARAPENGEVAFLALVDTRTGEIVRTAEPRCVTPRTPAPRPTPRDVGQAMRRERGLLAGIGMNPRLDGLTGLETWVWAQVPPAPVAVDASVRGFAGRVSAKPLRYRWDMGDGTTYTSNVAGSEQQPSTRHVYQAKGDYKVVLTVTWSGTFSFAGNGLVAPSAELGTVDIDYERDYHVAEARAVRR